MQSSEQRDEKTLVITGALGVFCLLIAVGGSGLWAVDACLDLSDTAVGLLSNVLAVSAGVFVIVRLARVRKG